MGYIWFIWSLILLGIWLTVYLLLDSKASRKEMLVVSLWTSLLGLTEPLFVPEYWSPPSLFNLALRTGFDLESLLFAFGMGGLAVAIYEVIFSVHHREITAKERQAPNHRLHFWILASAPLIFFLLFIFTDLNPIYSTFIALMSGGFLTWYCRPDLKKKMVTSAFIFVALYFLYFLTLIWIYPGYVELVWNLDAISGILIMGVPLEELMFAFGLGFLWSSIYEHVNWLKLSRN